MQGVFCRMLSDHSGVFCGGVSAGSGEGGVYLFSVSWHGALSADHPDREIRDGSARHLCSDKDVLDLLTKGETEQYMKLTDRTKEQAEQDYEDNIDSMMEGMGEVGLSDELTENYRTLYKDIYKKAKYTVTGAEKMKDKDGYTVTVEVEQMTGLFDGLEDEVTNRVMEEMANLTPDTTEDEINELVFQTMYDVLQERVDAISYNDPQTVTVEVLGEDGVYSITDDGYTDLDDALIDTAGM